MARVKHLQTRLTSGELDPLLRAQVELKHYHNGAGKLRNVLILPQGGGRPRFGTEYIETVPLAPSSALSPVRLMGFKFSTEQHYLFMFYHLGLKIYKDGALQATVTTPWAHDELNASFDANGNVEQTGISWTQSLDSLIVFHEDYQPRHIQRTGSDTSWAISTYTFDNIPRFAFPGETYVNGVDEVQKLEMPNPSGGAWVAGDVFKLILGGEDTDAIAYDANADNMRDAMQTALRAMPGTSADGITVTHDGTGASTTVSVDFTITLSGTEGKQPWGAMGFDIVNAENVPGINITVTTEGEKEGEDVWSATVGWPRCGVLWQGRLWMAGSKSRPQTLWGSRSGKIQDFNDKKSDDDYAINVTADTDDVSAIFNIHVGRHFQLFTSSGEFYIPKSDTEPITPQNISLRRSTQRGSKPGLRVFEVDGGTLFMQRRGRSLREFIYSDTELAYMANNISLLSSHLIRDPVDMFLRQSTSTEDADYLFFPNDDGTMATFCTLRNQEVNAFTLLETAGDFIAGAVDLDDIYLVVERTIDGTAHRYLERARDDLRVDCAVYDDALGSPASGITGATHLANETVDILLDDIPQAQGTVNGSGALTFDRDAQSSYQVGLPWPDVSADTEYPGLRWMVQTLPPEVQLSDGTMVGRKRRIVTVTAALYETTGLQINGNRISFRQFGSELLDQATPEFTGSKHERGFLGWDREGLLTIGDDVPTKATLLGLAYSIGV